MAKVKRYRCQHKDWEVLWLDAENTSVAGKKAAEEYGKMGLGWVDEYTIDVQEAPAKVARPHADPVYSSSWPTGGTLPGYSDDEPLELDLDDTYTGPIPRQPIGDDENTPVIDDPWHDLSFLVDELNEDDSWELPPFTD